nr:hypothetical protein [Tanacetum cinerariifolium]
THMITPRAYRLPTVSTSSLETKKRKEIAGESSSLTKSLKVTIKQKEIVNEEKDDVDSEDRLEPGNHKENPEVVDDDDDNEREKNDDKMDSLEIRNEETQKTIPTPLSSLRKLLSSDKKFFQELTNIVSIPPITTSKHSQVKKRISSKYSHLLGALRMMCKRQGYMIQNMERKCVTTGKFWETHNKVDQVLKEVVPEIAENMKRSLKDRADNITLWEALRHKFENYSTSYTSYREDEFHSHHDEHQEDDAPPEGEKRVKRSKKIKVYKVIPEDVTSELIAEFQIVDKRVPTIFDRARMEATLKDALSNQFRNAEEYAYHLEQSTNFIENQIVWESRQQDIPRIIAKTLIFYRPQRNPNEPPRCLYNKDLFFLKYGNTKERKYILSLHKIHAEEFPEPDLEEKLNRWVRKEFKTFNEDARKKVDNQKIKLMNSLITFIKSHAIWERVYDIQLGIKSYQIRVNLTAPTLTFLGIKEHVPYSIVDEPQMGLIYLNSKDEERVMYLEEIVKFFDATLEKVLNEVKLKMFESQFLKNPPLLNDLDQDIIKAYEREISKHPSHRQQMRRWESFMNGRPILPTMKRL